MKSRIATISGQMLVPGVSKNRRLYTKENIGRAVARMQERISSPDGLPLTMLTHHEAGDASTAIAGRITKVEQDPQTGVARFEADIPNTAAGRDIATLTSGPQPYLKTVSIRGRWAGPVRTEVINLAGKESDVETADDIEVDGVDFTKSPGVAGAVITAVKVSENVGGGGTGGFILESVDAELTLEADKQPYGSVTYADPGYQADGVKRYPLDTARHVRAAWSYINMPRNSKKYTAAQLKRIRGRIKSAAGKFNIDIADESANLAALAWYVLSESTPVELDEAYFSVSADNGPATVSVSIYGDDPDSVFAAAGTAASIAIGGITALDPDGDGDVDPDSQPEGSKEDKDEVDYREGSGKKVCENCAHYTSTGPIGGICELVEGSIGAGMVCNLFAKAGESAGGTTQVQTVEGIESMETAKETKQTAENSEAAETATEELSEATRTAITAAVAEAATSIKDAVLSAVKESMDAAAKATAKESKKQAKAAAKAAKVESAKAGKTRKADESAAAGDASVTESGESKTTTAETATGDSALTEALKPLMAQFHESLEAAKAEMRAAVVEAYGPPKRKGFVVTESTEGTKKPLHEMTREELDKVGAEAAERLLPGLPPTALVVG